MPQGIHLTSGPAVVGQVVLSGVAYDVKQITINFTALGPSTMVSAVVGKRIRVIGFFLWPSTNTSLEWRSGVTVIVQPLEVEGRRQFGQIFLPGYWTQTAVGEALILRQNVSTPANVRGIIQYIEVS